MLQNAKNAGFTESEIEILTEEEYKVRKEPEPQIPTSQERLDAVEQALLNLIMEGMV